MFLYFLPKKMNEKSLNNSPKIGVGVFEETSIKHNSASCWAGMKEKSAIALKQKVLRICFHNYLGW